MTRKKPAPPEPPAPRERERPIRVQLHEIEDDQRAAEFIRAILRAQALTAARKTGRESREDDAA